MIEIVHEKKEFVKIKWNKSGLGENDEIETKEKLQPTKWSPKITVPGSLCRYLSGVFEK